MGFKEAVTGFAGKVGDTIDRGIEAGKGSYQKMSEKSRINKEINQLSAEINDTFLNIGRSIYQNSPDCEEYSSEFLSVREKYAKINSLKQQLSLLDGMIICPKCQCTIPSNSKVCNQCGAAISVIEPVAQNTDSTSTKTCPSCGTEMPTGAKFCGKCGQPL